MTYIGDANDVATILSDADTFFSRWFAASDDQEVEEINERFQGTPATLKYDAWQLGRLTSALVQVYDLVGCVATLASGGW